MGSRHQQAARSLRSHRGIRLVRLQVQDAPFLLHSAALVQGVCGFGYLSILNPILRVTWNSTTAPSLILPRSSTTWNHSMFRSVFAASATPALVASAKLVGEVPTSSVILYVPGMLFLLGQLALPVAMHSNSKRPFKETGIEDGGPGRRKIKLIHYRVARASLTVCTVPHKIKSL